MSLDETLLVPEAKSPLSIRATRRPRSTASRATPAPVMPPPRMIRSNRPASSASSERLISPLLQPPGQSVDAALALVAGLGEALDRDLAGLQVIEHDGLGGGQLGAGRADLRGDAGGDGRDPIQVAVQEVAGVDGDAADVDGHVHLRDVAVAVGADGAAGEAGEVQPGDLFEV